ncbi:hypothetical protein [Enterococcus gilvus]|uniref:hypothetical protein n=1 Tax=Enterococcus gilvus TaxID=160453 RepID=UPI001C8CB9B3|nr:hypothetical protein [Enterococcus gilvus]
MMEEKTKIERKNNKSVKTAVLLFGAVLITMSLLGGTLAKYIGDIGTATDSARVAKWYVSDGWKSFDLFEASYKTDDPNGNSGKDSVKSSTTENVFAPGTKGSSDLLAMYPAKKPEVAYKMQLNVNTEIGLKIPMNGVDQSFNTNALFYSDHVKDEGWAILNPYYWAPLKFRLYDKKGQLVYNGISDKNDNSISATTLLATDPDFKNQVKALNDGTEITVDTEIPNNLQTSAIAWYINKHPELFGTDIIYPEDTISGDSIKLGSIEWVWPFENKDKTPQEQEYEDKYDTNVGKNAATAIDNDEQAKVPRVAIQLRGTQVQVD